MPLPMKLALVGVRSIFDLVLAFPLLSFALVSSDSALPLRLTLRSVCTVSAFTIDARFEGFGSTARQKPISSFRKTQIPRYSSLALYTFTRTRSNHHQSTMPRFNSGSLHLPQSGLPQSDSTIVGESVQMSRPRSDCSGRGWSSLYLVLWGTRDGQWIRPKRGEFNVLGGRRRELEARSLR